MPDQIATGRRPPSDELRIRQTFVALVPQPETGESAEARRSSPCARSATLASVDVDLPWGFLGLPLGVQLAGTWWSSRLQPWSRRHPCLRPPLLETLAEAPNGERLAVFGRQIGQVRRGEGIKGFGAFGCIGISRSTGLRCCIAYFGAPERRRMIRSRFSIATASSQSISHNAPQPRTNHRPAPPGIHFGSNLGHS
jgi:hypothetical protein